MAMYFYGMYYKFIQQTEGISVYMNIKSTTLPVKYALKLFDTDHVFARCVELT
jgi:hypothetical protein